MGYHPRIETTNVVTFATTRCKNSHLWLINNRELEQVILGYLAKFTARYKVKLYAFAIEGNHIHDTALFPEANRSHFMRDLNSCVARAVSRYVSRYPGGRLWARRYSAEFIPTNEDIERRFFYTVLQPVQDGLVDNIQEYRWYNCFEDAVKGRSRTFKIMNWAAYNEAKRYNKNVRRLSFLQEFELKYERLPGYENLSQKEYKVLMYEKLERYTAEVIRKRGPIRKDKREHYKKQVGSVPFKTKRSGRYDYRPRIICYDLIKRASYMRWYFGAYLRYRQASILYRSGDTNVKFPAGTYKPPVFTMKYTVPVLDLLI